MDEKPKPKVILFSGIMREKAYVLKASIACVLFWFIEFAYQFYIISNTYQSSLIISSAFTGATMISFALVTGPLARLTKYNFIKHRRTLAVWGFTFGLIHVAAVIVYSLGFDVSLLFLTLDPYLNPTLFGLLAMIVFIPLYLTSTDWALSRLNFMRWKTLHRIVYVGYIFLMLHYMLVNPPALQNLAGYLLLGTTALAVILQIAGFATTIRVTRSKKAALFGIVVIVFGFVMLYLAYFS